MTLILHDKVPPSQVEASLKAAIRQRDRHLERVNRLSSLLAEAKAERRQAYRDYRSLMASQVHMTDINGMLAPYGYGPTRWSMLRPSVDDDGDILTRRQLLAEFELADNACNAADRLVERRKQQLYDAKVELRRIRHAVGVLRRRSKL